MVLEFPRFRHLQLDQITGLVAAEAVLATDALETLGLSSLDTSRAPPTMSADFLNVDRGRDDLDVVERELRALRHDLAVDRDERAAVVVESITIASLLVCVEVYSSGLERNVRSARLVGGRSKRADFESGLFDEVDPSRELAQLVVTPTRVGEDLHAIKAHVDVRSARKM